MTYEDFCSRLENVKGNGVQRTARCPAHNDHNNSLSVGVGRNGDIVLYCHAGCEPAAIVEALGLTLDDLFTRPSAAQDFPKAAAQIVAMYDYTDENGKLIAQKLRKADKTFSWRQPDGRHQWIYRKPKAPLLYNMPALRSDAVYIVEGEKDVDTLTKLGKSAVSAADGAGGKGKWPSALNKRFKGKHVLIIQDNDAPGKAFAIETANNLHGIAASVRLLDLANIWPNIPEHGDITDYIEAGGNMEQLVAYVSKLPIYSPQEVPDGTPIKFTRMSSIEPKRAEYLFKPYVTKGKLTIVAGVSGATKTWLILYLASLCTTGKEFISDDPFTVRQPSVVIYQTKENDLETDVRPRLDKLGANLDNIIVIDERDEDGNGFPLSLADGRVEAAIKQFNATLVIFDPIQSFLGEDVDMHRANEVRPILDRLIDMAGRHNCAIILVSHMSKQTTAAALDRILGSSDFRNAARSICIIGSDPDDPERRVLAHAKNSLGLKGESIAYHIDDVEGLVVEEFCDLDEDAIVQPLKNKGRNKPSISLDEAIEFLNEMLGKDGYAKLADIKAKAKERGISERTLYRAKDELLLRPLKIGFSKNKTTWWLCPDVAKEDVAPAEQTVLPDTS